MTKTPRNREDVPAARSDRGTGLDSRSSAPPTLLPGPAELLDPRGPFLLPLLLLVLARLFYAWRIPLAAEDAYITFRYARNLVAGHGLVFNPGQHVMGFTSPLWTLWTALGIRLIGDPLVWTRIWAVLADALTLVLVARMLAQTASLASARIFGVFFALWPYFSAVGASSMENGPMLCLVVLSAALVERGSRMSGLALAALALWRPEGLAAGALLSISARPRDRGIALATTAVGLGVLAAYYGTVIPQSVLAKAAVYGTPGPWVGRQWWDWFVPMPLGRAPGSLEGVHLFVLSVVWAPAVIVGARELWTRRNQALSQVAFVGLSIWLGYSLLGVAYFYWYLVVPLAGHLILASVGLPRIVRGRSLYVSATVFVVAMCYQAQSFYVGRVQNEYLLFGRAAQYLAENERAGQKVMLEPIGLVGYFTNLEVVDEVGLVSPRVARRRLQGPGWYTDVVREERPDWLVSRRLQLTSNESFAGTGVPFRSAAERDSLLAGYRTETTIEPQRGEQALVVLRRR